MAPTGAKLWRQFKKIVAIAWLPTKNFSLLHLLLFHSFVIYNRKVHEVKVGQWNISIQDYQVET